MRVQVLLTDGFGGHGGIAKFNRDLLSALCAYPGCSEVIGIPRLMSEPRGDLPAKLTYDTTGLGGKLAYVGTVLRRHALGSQVDLVICAHVNLLTLARLSQALSRAPLLLIVHGVDAWQPTGRPVTDRLARKVSTFLAVSEFTRKRFLAWTGLDPQRGFVVPNCINPREFGPGPRRGDLVARYGLQGQRVLMTLGRLSADERYKGVDEVLEVLPDLAKEIPNLAYLIAGDGSDRPRLEQKVKALGLADRVVLAGRVADTEKADHYRLADAFVMPGFGEGFGIVYLEAMACGVPVVASNADASCEAVRHGKLGIVVNPRDPEDLKAGIRCALAHPVGEVPRGLEYFSFENFQSRVHSVVAHMIR
jgi:phosphatidyl-myo-inositol dimannoside synthase